MKRMRRIGCRELRNQLAYFLRAVRRGEHVVITDRGTPVAKLCPVPHPTKNTGPLEDVLYELELQGSIRRSRGRLRNFNPVKWKGRPASQIIIEDRR